MGFSASRIAGLVAAVSERALIILAAPDESFDHEGINPHRIRESSWPGSLRMLTDDGHGLSESDVVAGSPVRFFGNGSVEIFFDELPSPRKSVAPAHEEIMANRVSIQAFHPAGWRHERKPQTVPIGTPSPFVTMVAFRAGVRLT
jgi:hypothetical protein